MQYKHFHVNHPERDILWRTVHRERFGKLHPRVYASPAYQTNGWTLLERWKQVVERQSGMRFIV